jgi:hypothetical protein
MVTWHENIQEALSNYSEVCVLEETRKEASCYISQLTDLVIVYAARCLSASLNCYMMVYTAKCLCADHISYIHS